MYVKFWGVRGSIPTPGHTTGRFGGNTSCVEVRTQGGRFICDAGTGIRALGQQMIQDAAGDAIHAHLLLSHPHWDHIQGFPFFVPAYIPTTRLTVYGRDPGDRRFYELLSGQMDSDYFPVHFSDLQGRVEPDHLDGGRRVLGDTTVSVLPVCHPGGSLSYRLEGDGGCVIYSTDNELDLLIENKAEAEDPAVLRKLPADLVEFIRGADLLIADGQYTDEEYKTRVSWGHSRASSCVDLAVQAGVPRLAVFHHDPMQTDAQVDAKIQACRDRARLLGASELVVFGAREGVELRLDDQ